MRERGGSFVAGTSCWRRRPPPPPQLQQEFRAVMVLRFLYLISVAADDTLCGNTSAGNCLVFPPGETAADSSFTVNTGRLSSQ